jgi:hypothetical protein
MLSMEMALADHNFAPFRVLKNHSRSPEGVLQDICVFAQVPRNVEKTS